MYIIGLDIGSVSINGVVIKARVLSSDKPEDFIVEELPYKRHFGLVKEETLAVLESLINRYGKSNIKAVAFSGANGEIISKIVGGFYEVETIAQVIGALRVCPGVRTIISIGGQDAVLFQIGYGENGNWYLEGFNINGPCASGTGSFIDQQAERLAQAMYGSDWKPSQEHLQETLRDFINLGLQSSSLAPVACRCTVFTKSDMIHLQNKGEPLPNIIAGLHFGNAANYISTIVGNREIKEPVIFIGGVASNELQVRAFKKYFPNLTVPPYHTSLGALGVALIALEKNISNTVDLESLLKAAGGGLKQESFPRAEPLRLEFTVFEDSSALPPPKRTRNKIYRGFLGIDVGSTTTKYAFINEKGEIIHKNYVPTRGRPIEVTQNLLKGLFQSFGGRIEIIGIATTGSGRNVVGDFVNADLIVDEITAHARGAVHIDPEVDTIFEIGGQDSKYIRVDRTHPIDFDMNKVCAAGTGSFLHELANKMKINIVGEFQEIALSSTSPISLAERCTVFMESDIAGFLQKGARREDLIAGLCYAIVHNYLNRVVGKRFIGSRIMFLGGPSLNKGIVSAFERVLKKPITVPKHREVMGAFGAALLVKEQFERTNLFPDKKKLSERKKALEELIEAEVSYKETICHADPKCHNECKLKIYNFGGRKSIWGGDCGRYEITRYEGQSEKDYIGERNKLFWEFLSELDLEPGKISSGNSSLPIIGIPLGLHFWEWAIFWSFIFRKLDFPVIISPKTDHRITSLGIESITAETCFPVKVFHGHVKVVSERADKIFLPDVINMIPYHEKETAFFCPLVQSSHYMSKQALGIDDGRIINFKVYFKEGPERVAKKFYRVIRQIHHFDEEKISRVVKKAWDRYFDFRRTLVRIGEEVLQDALSQEKPVWIISGRPYNLYDVRLNLQLGQHLAKRGIMAIPMDMIDLSVENISDFPKMYWGLGARILRTAKKIARNPYLYGLHITNFSCGPDSFIEHFYRHILQEKPALVLEFDEHTAFAGVLTRIEAYQNVVKNLTQNEKFKAFEEHKIAN